MTTPAIRRPQRVDLDSEESYRLLRRKLVLFFHARGCFDPAQHADEVVMRVIQAVSKGGELRDLTAFAFGVAKNVYADLVKDSGRSPAADVGPPPVNSSPRAICLGRCLGRLPPDARELIEAFFVDRERAALAKTLGISPNALRIRIYRLKGRLKSCLDDCLRSVHRK